MAKRSLPAQLTNRTPLQNLIPLDTPYSVLVSPIDYCNIKCAFCPFHGEVRGDERAPSVMPFETFKKIVDGLAEFPNKLKTFIFCGRGEPTLHKNIADMIAYAKNADIADELRMTTNGFLLTPKLNKTLVDAGLDYIRISVPAIDDKTCFELTGAHLDLDKYISNIKSLYDNKRPDMTVFCKITNVALGGRDGCETDPVLSKKFFDLFDDCCDYAFIENVVPQVIREFTEEEKKKIWIGPGDIRNVYSIDNEKSSVCERLFYHFTINSKGEVFPCDLNESPNLKLGNVNADKLTDIWNGDKYFQLRLNTINGAADEACEGCGVAKFDMPNCLHKYADKIRTNILKAKERIIHYGKDRTASSK